MDEYTIAMVASHGVMNFVKLHIEALLKNKIRFKNLVIGDAGLTNGDKQFIRSKIDAEFYAFEFQVFDKIETQSPAYQNLIAQRTAFLIELSKHADKILQIDADTTIVGNDFRLLDKSCDLTLMVREVTPKDHCLDMYEHEYPNLGVVFWHNLNNCKEFIEQWNWVTYNEQPLKQFEQGNFYRAMQLLEFGRLKVQKLHCRFYNCYNPRWISPKTQIIHYKGCSEMRFREIGTYV